jgi:hypothetical protein
LDFILRDGGYTGTPAAEKTNENHRELIKFFSVVLILKLCGLALCVTSVPQKPSQYSKSVNDVTLLDFHVILTSEN